MTSTVANSQNAHNLIVNYLPHNFYEQDLENFFHGC
eukprot:UN03875